MPEQANNLKSLGMYQPFLESERTVRVQYFRLASVLAAIFMFAASALDWFVYRPYFFEFLVWRIICCMLIMFLWWLVKTPFGAPYYEVLGVLFPALPAFFLSLFIYKTEGALSSYYGALNLVLLGTGIVVRLSVAGTIIVFAETMVMYLAACILHGLPNEKGIFFTNSYFLFVTGAFVVLASHFYNKLRFREFCLRFELDENRRSLAESNQKLKELDQVKSRFFANISHELRTPLTLLIAPLENMMQKFGRAVDEETRNTLHTMHSNGMRLLKLINDLLDLVRLESGVMQVKCEPLAVEHFIRGIASSVRQVADDKRIKLETHVEAELGTVLVDRDKLEKILLNLVFNALKFTPANGRVEVRAEKQNDEFVLIVRDTGVGISEQNLKNVFSRFWQADDSSRRKYQGVGIGLALVKELAEIQGGRAEVQSAEGKGTTFTIHLPYQKADAVAEPRVDQPETPAVIAETGGTVTSQEWLANLYRRAEMFPAMTPLQDTVHPIETSMRNGNRPTVLVADDEPDMLRFLKSQLGPHYNVIEAVDGQQAVDKSGQFLPDVIVLDMMMPEKDGLQACKEIRQRTSTGTIPIILLTARADEQTKLEALKNGATDFLAKPFSTTELHVRIRNLIESYQYQIKLAKQNTVLENTIEQLKETEAELVQTEKLASLGRMSAGIIHEINNPLNFATTGLFTLKNKGKHLAPEQREEYAEILKDVEEGIKRVRNIVSDLRSFTHHDNAHMEHIEVSDIVAQALRFMSHEWRDTVQLEQNLTEHQTIWVNKNKMIQVLVNLLQNSLDALRRKKFESGEKPTLRIESKIEDNQSVLVIRDNGEGIAPENMDKIFDPFFTTKDVGEGMGLGLSITYRIVHEYDGRIEVKSEPGKFTEFRLEFPLKGESLKTESKAA